MYDKHPPLADKERQAVVPLNRVNGAYLLGDSIRVTAREFDLMRDLRTKDGSEAAYFAAPDADELENLFQFSPSAQTY
jgi:hypothetical protein